MNVKILEVSSKELTRAIIREGEGKEMPSIQDGWIFDFKKHSKSSGSNTYVLVQEDSPNILEGCMIFSMHESFGPFMDYLEVAPHNKGLFGKYKYVSGCLIAYACGLSLEKGLQEDKGILTFEASGKNPELNDKLENFYHEKYGAIKNPFGFMEIYQDRSKMLVEEYLNRE